MWNICKEISKSSNWVIAALCVLALTSIDPVGGSKDFYRHQPLSNVEDFDIVHPIRLDSAGNFLTHNLRFMSKTRDSKSARKKRAANENSISNSEQRVLYSVPFGGKQMTLNLTENEFLVPNNYLVERIENIKSKKDTVTSSFTPGSHTPCHYRGHVEGQPESKVALSACNGLTGFISTADGDFLLEPLEPQRDNFDDRLQPHKLYRQDVSSFINKAKPMLRLKKVDRQKSGSNTGRYTDFATSSAEELPFPFRKNVNDFCGVLDTNRRYQHIVNRRERWESKHGKPASSKQDSAKSSKRRSKRSVSVERLIEMLVVADKSMVDFYEGNEHGGVEKYVLTIVNMVSELFKDASIGNAIQVSLVRLILLEDEKEGPEITSHAENTLDNFCRWAKKINPKGDDHPNHHDVAVLLTRREICSGSNKSCETLGLAHVAGMCQSHRSCSLNQDIGLSVAYTVAHELGHNFAMHHDGQSNDCRPSSKHNHLMAPHLTSNKLPMKWSSCSRRYITRFLDRNWGSCLRDKPAPHPEFTPSTALPGVVYDADHQCRLMFGDKSRYCPGVGDMCDRLWCYVGGTCRTRLHAAAAGTKCGRHKWCLGGRCVSMRKHPKKVNGGWGDWSEWTPCSRTCGIGVKSSTRSCDSPVPRNGGNFCVGARKRYQTCSIWRCPYNADGRTFRAQQCSEFDQSSYKNRTLNWLPVESTVYPCELHCYTRSGKVYFADRLRAKVVDGTKCFEGSNDICVDGICRRLGCDKNVGSRALEDSCGVCHGDGSACYHVDKTFSRRKGEEYTAVSLLPIGARNLEIKEVKPVSNFLALRHATNRTHYYLNGNYMIQWDTKFQLAGTQFSYRRINEVQDVITAPGPLTDELMLMVLFVEENPGVSVTYTMPYDLNFDPDPEPDPPAFGWKIEGWSECSHECGTGSKFLQIKCYERITGPVEEFLCNATNRPADDKRLCNEFECPARWSTSPWGPCSVTCGNKRGLQHRTIGCLRSLGEAGIENLNETECEHLRRPETRRKCHSKERAPCPIWRTGEWQECSPACGNSLSNRTVRCITFIEEDIIDINGEDEEEIIIEDIDINNIREGVMGKKRVKSVSRMKTVEVKPIDFDPEVDGYEVDDGFCDVSSKPLTSKKCDVGPCPTTTSYSSNTTASLTTSEVENGTHLVTSKASDTNESLSPSHHKDNNSLYETPAGIFYQPRKTANLSHRANNDESNADIALNFTLPSRITANQSVVNESLEVSTNYTSVPTYTDKNLYSPGIEMTTGEILTGVPPTYQHSQKSGLGNIRQSTPFLHEIEPEDDTTTSSSILNEKERKLEEIVQKEKENYPTESQFDKIQDQNFVTSPLSPTSHQNLKTKSEHPATSFKSSTPTAATTPTKVEILDDNAIQIHHHELNERKRDIFQIVHARTTYEDVAADEFDVDVNDETESERTDKGTPTHNLPQDIVVPDIAETQIEFDVNHIQSATLSSTTSTKTNALATSTLKQNEIQDVTISAGPDDRSRSSEALPTTSTVETKMNVKGEWIVGEWGKCSVTCGVGARIRQVHCSLQDEKLCNQTDRPAPAMICDLRPCAKWAYGEWGQCSTLCGSGVRTSKIECTDERTGKILRPHHCRNLPRLPAVNISCQQNKCLSWRTSRWSSCSEPCGTGKQRRRVACPRPGQCEQNVKPTEVKSCYVRLCVDWKPLSWNKCSVHCGGGIRRREVVCVERDTGVLTNSTLCPPGLKPSRYERCNQGQCPVTDYDFANCHADRLSETFCVLLQKLGRCVQPSLAIQCCETCKTYVSVRQKDKIS